MAEEREGRGVASGEVKRSSPERKKPNQRVRRRAVMVCRETGGSTSGGTLVSRSVGRQSKRARRVEAAKFAAMATLRVCVWEEKTQQG